MKDTTLRLAIAAGLFVAFAMATYTANKVGAETGYAAGYAAGRRERPAMTAPAVEIETPWNIYYIRGATVTDEGGSLGFGITFTSPEEARRFVATLEELQQYFKPQQ